MTSGLSMISWPEAFKSHFVSSYGTPSKSLDNPGFKHNSSSVYAQKTKVAHLASI